MNDPSSGERAYGRQARYARRRLGLARLYEDKAIAAGEAAYVRILTSTLPPPGSVRVDGLALRYANVTRMRGGRSSITIGLSSAKKRTWPDELVIKANDRVLGVARRSSDSDGERFHIYGQPSDSSSGANEFPKELSWSYVPSKSGAKIDHYKYRQDLYSSGQWAGTLFGR